MENLNDHIYSGNVDLGFQIFENPELPKLKVGYLFDKKDQRF